MHGVSSGVMLARVAGDSLGESDITGGTGVQVLTAFKSVIWIIKTGMSVHIHLDRFCLNI